VGEEIVKEYAYIGGAGGWLSVRQNGGYAERVLHSSIVDPGFQSNAQLVAEVRPREATAINLRVAWCVAILTVSCRTEGEITAAFCSRT